MKAKYATQIRAGIAAAKVDIIENIMVIDSMTTVELLESFGGVIARKSGLRRLTTTLEYKAYARFVNRYGERYYDVFKQAKSMGRGNQ